MKSHIISLVILFSSLPSQAMLVRAVQPLARRIASRLLTPKAAPQKLVQQVPQTPVRTAPRAVVRQLTPRTPWQKQLFKTRSYYRPYAKPTWLLPAGIGTLGASTLNRYAYAEPIKVNEVKPWAEVEKQYRTLLEAEEKDIIRRIQEFLNLTPEEWEQKKEKFLPKYLQLLDSEIKREQQKNKKPVPTELKNTIAHLLQKEGIDPETITIISNPNVTLMRILGGSITNRGAIMFNETSYQWFARQPKPALEAVILHEIQHLKNNDHFTTLFIQSIGTTACWFKYLAFAEKRADILAGLASPDHAGYFSAYFRLEWDLNSWYGKLKTICKINDPHPYDSTRASYLKKLYGEMIACAKQQKSDTTKS